jgi:hypothetical protein
MYRSPARCDSVAMTAIRSFPPAAHQLRELDRRSNHGIDVALLWDERDNRVVVAVSDARAGTAFEIELRAGDEPLDVFHHPYAYAAWRGIDTTWPALEALPWAA